MGHWRALSIDVKGRQGDAFFREQSSARSSPPPPPPPCGCVVVSLDGDMVRACFTLRRSAVRPNGIISSFAAEVIVSS